MWVASFNEDYWEEYPTKERAIEDFPIEYGMEKGDYFYIGRAVQPTIEDLPIEDLFDVDYLLDRLDESINDSEWGYDGRDNPYLPDFGVITKQQIHSVLTSVFTDWLKHHWTPKWFSVKGVEKIDY